MWHVWETGEVHTGCWCEGLRAKDHAEILGVDGKIIVKLDLSGSVMGHGMD
jgi:hypothetical protein